jgi:hypothetical protein
VCCGEQLLSCLVSYFSLCNFQGRDLMEMGCQSINVLLGTKELPFSCLVGS